MEQISERDMDAGFKPEISEMNKEDGTNTGLDT